MKRAAIVLVVLALVGAAGYWIYKVRYEAPPPSVMTSPVTRGDIVDAVGASGTLEAVTTVQVGTQVSGTIQELYADFNSIVRKGQVIARLDPSLFTTQIDQARANLVRAEADVERLRVALEDARSKLARAENLAEQQLIPAQDLEAAQLTVRSTEAQLRSSQAQVTQARATLNQNQVNLQHTVIEAPIDGIVISRNVDVGQTVAASMQAPTLFVLAADLTKMKVNASIDEADVGRIRPGQVVRFRVDAYPDRDFTGSVSQVRLQPVVTSNVVTYATVIDVPNPDLLLKPGMTANVNIEIARRENVLRAPNAALRFRPTAETFAALGLPVPEELTRPRGARSNARGTGEGTATPAAPGAPGTGVAAPAAPAAAPPAPGAVPGRVGDIGTLRTDVARARVDGSLQEQAPRPRGEGGRRPDGARGGSPEERRQQLRERLAQMPPGERAAFLERLKARGVDVTGLEPGASQPAAPQAPGGQRGRPAVAAQSAAPGPAARPAPGTTAAPGSPGTPATFDALFGPLPVTESVGRAWVYAEGQLRPVRLRLGVTDGTHTEVLEGEVTEGLPLVTNVAITQAAASNAGRSPLMGPQRGGPPGARNTGGGSRR